jgi:hypothetical protein
MLHIKPAAIVVTQERAEFIDPHATTSRKASCSASGSIQTCHGIALSGPKTIADPQKSTFARSIDTLRRLAKMSESICGETPVSSHNRFFSPVIQNFAMILYSASSQNRYTGYTIRYFFTYPKKNPNTSVDK